MANKLYWIWLTMVFGAGNPRVWELLRECEDVKDAYDRVLNGKYSLTSGEKVLFAGASLEKAEEIVHFCEKENIFIFTYDDEKYPSLLKSIFNPPVVLFVAGNEDVFESELSITVVGTRNSSDYGLNAALKISTELAKSGFTLISGFAMGIDSVVHRAALSQDGCTIAVLGCGIDVVYPKANSDIREMIMKKGAFVTEFLPGTPPLGKNFPIRNRILSGLSLGVFVVEAPYGSGALITADLAIEQGRDVFCLPPHDIFSSAYQGVVKYLRDGAVPVFGHLDIVYEYYTTFSHKLSSLKPEMEYISADDSSLFSKKSAKRKDSFKSTELEKPAETVDISYDGLSELQIKIVDFLRNGAKHIDEIGTECSLDMAQLLTEITDLEISGIIKSLPGKLYSL